jgi:hypothetical protein
MSATRESAVERELRVFVLERVGKGGEGNAREILVGQQQLNCGCCQV